MLVLSLFGCGKSRPVENIVSFDFGYSTGNYMNASVCCTLKLENGVYTATLKRSGVAEKDADVFTVGDSFVNELTEIINRYSVGRWDGFSKSDRRVLDGNSFHLYLRTEDDRSVSAHGYMKWPKNYSSVKGEILSLFDSLCAEEQK